ncbi:hypothetical protein H112_00505 [Trichophyton rubrum D6]|uniref:Uncharacterized protein n=2 Tax=Trichophyton TaxID=5550 RepID=A0A022WGC4_TRIRU|nr:hypothetical protein H100_00503 [Trichophyton rubrum MR850]EZF46527.1 hypothetical protein H102_00504 [Trichophyton rubrum CBS 100081]EZF57088.1 hypothetical protein H103_00503 [Trichophyton rubrum CBS 288.86]EZF67784.1 hypothetical protein H104_00493 [Trichophyton rubrum CBS 289.86]EZF78459.1 hypothetical protein H105_00491 [Trichophyton soudanense CBS 452.61]EZF89028.1 hypothetical protein H110_00508 [Trichophyton rubrum MR1448]EZF99907.1 hypothetical protein H113_00508 [Trichophyton rub
MPGTAGEYSLWFDRHEADRSVARKHKAKRSMVFIADEHQALNSAFKRKRQDALIITLSSFATTISQHGKAFGIGPVGKVDFKYNNEVKHGDRVVIGDQYRISERHGIRFFIMGLE